tara:strand:- start:19 stop:483 length:465 start_codon:yes stop_codon:yes gene_type:complete
MKININNKHKINNPIDFIQNGDPAFINSLESNFDESIFFDSNSEYHQHLKHQAVNFYNLKNLLLDINLEFEYIWLIIFRNLSGGIATSFIIKTNTNEQGLTVFWRKYMSRATGSGQNDLFLVKDEELVEEGGESKIKVQLTKYLKKPNIFNELI